MLFVSCDVHYSSSVNINCNIAVQKLDSEYQTGSRRLARSGSTSPAAPQIRCLVSASPAHQSEVYARGAPPLSTPQHAMRAPALRGDSGGAATAPVASAPLTHVQGL